MIDARLSAEREQLASVFGDPLTGLVNRRMLMERLGSELERAVRYERPFTILLLDLDKFKRINDAYGHLTGDHVLKRFSRLIEKALRGVDLVGRYGGEEFLAILPETDATGAEEVADRIRLGIAGAEVLETAVAEHAAYIAGETLAVDLEVGASAVGDSATATTIEIDELEATIAMERLTER